MNTPSPSRKLGRRIQALREVAGMTPSDLASAAGMTVADLAAVEAGVREVDYLALVRIARALGRPVADLLAAMDEAEDGDLGET